MAVGGSKEGRTWETCPCPSPTHRGWPLGKGGRHHWGVLNPTCAQLSSPPSFLNVASGDVL